jgi:uncharacterized protein (DUF927 family)
MSLMSRPLAVCTFRDKTTTTPKKTGELTWGEIVELHTRRRLRPGKDGALLGGYKINGPRKDANVLFRSLIQLDIDTKGTKDPATDRILTIKKAAPPLDQICAGIAEYEWVAPSSHWHEPRRGVIKYRIVILPDRDIQRDEWTPLLEALDERLGGVLDRDAWQWSQTFYLPSCPAENEGDAFFEHNEGGALPVDEFVRRGREIIAAKSRPSARLPTPAHPGGAAGGNILDFTRPPPPVEEMRALLRHLVARDCFEHRRTVVTDDVGHIVKVGWIEAGMALKVAYGDEDGFDLWGETHEDDQARADAPSQWRSFAAEARPGQVTIATIIKAARDAGFGLRSAPSTAAGALASATAAAVGLGHRSYGPFTMDADEGLIKEVMSGRGKAAAPVPVWISAPFEVLGACRDPHGRAWGKQIQFRDADGRLHMRHVPDASLHGDPATLCADLAGEGLTINRKRQKELAEYLSGVVVSERVMVVGRTGWHEIRGARVFVLPGEPIALSTGERVALDGVAHGPYEACGSLEDWKRGVGALTAGHALPVFMVSAALAGPLAYLVGAEGGGAHVCGPSSIGKSAIMAAGASVWGRGGAPGYVRSWRATANGLEGAAASATDTCLVLDELGVGNPREVADSIYGLANGTGKQRARRDGSLQAPKSWRVFVLSSGELSIERKIEEDHGRKARAGQTVRVLDIPADRGLGHGVFDNPGAFADAGKLADAVKAAATTSYGTAGPAFVRGIIEQDPDKVSTWAKKGIEKFVQQHVTAGASEQVGRVTHKLGVIAVAGELAIALGIAQWAKGDAWDAAALALAEWIRARGGPGSHEEAKAVAQVRLVIEKHGDARFEPLTNVAPHPVSNRLGWRRGSGTGEEWCVAPEAWKAEVCAGLDHAAVAKTLAQRGMLRLPNSGRRLTQLIKIEGRPTRVYVITASILN